ncbi:MAG: ATP-binding cassette domain-containing protein [Candidatus Zixiibacteriota bacterium]
MAQWPLIDIRHLKVKNERGDLVFTDLSIELQPGQSMIITGPAGSGKTTIAELLVGLKSPYEGSLELFGEAVKPGRTRQMRKFRRKIGGVGGPWGLIPSMTVTENILLPLIIAGERPRTQRERLRKMLNEFGLSKVAGHHPAHLTRVESTLCQIARASIANQPLVVLDEPSAGLDIPTYQHVCEYMVKASVSGRSMLVLSSELPPQEIPGSIHYRIVNGRLE